MFSECSIVSLLTTAAGRSSSHPIKVPPVSQSAVAILSQHSSLSTSYAATIITLGWEGSDAIMELVEEEESSKINRVHDAWEVGIGLRETLTSRLTVKVDLSEFHCNTPTNTGGIHVCMMQHFRSARSEDYPFQALPPCVLHGINRHH